jgi:ADP-ribose pyrophosphatase
VTEGWKVLERAEVLDCSPWFKVTSETVLLEDGRTVVPDFYQIEAASFSMIFALTVERQVALVEQYKHAVGQRILELPAGYIEAGEDPLVGAKRELLEETGLQAPRWHSLGAFIKDGNRNCGTCHAYLALDAEQVADPDPGDLQVQTLRFFDLERLRAFWRSGRCLTLDSTAVMGLGLAVIDAQGEC